MFINFKSKIVLKADLGSTQVSIKHQKGLAFIKEQDRLELNLDLCFNDNENISLLEFSGFKAEPSWRISIERLEINGYDVRDFQSLLSFQMKDNAYVENKMITKTQSIDFNGVLFINTKQNRDRLLYFPTTYSNERKDIVYKNSLLNCQSDYGCTNKIECRHDPSWKIFDLNKFVTRDSYDYLILGCSITAGTGILKKESWPALIGDKNKTVLTLGVPGGGCDTIFSNLKYILKKKIKFKKIIILLPNMGRRLYKIKKNNLFFQIPVTAGSDQTIVGPGQFNIFYDRSELDILLNNIHRKTVMHYNKKRDTQIIKRLIAFLESIAINYYISSWNNEVYQILKQNTKQSSLLEIFNEANDNAKGKDGSHPAEHIHKKWLETNEKKIGLAK